MNSKRQKQGFTLLEVIIVIIIVGVLASLALPRFFGTVEFSRSTEALNIFSALRDSMERCYSQHSGSYDNCAVANLDIPNPDNTSGTHFTYGLTLNGTVGYTIVATRNSNEGGSSSSTITLLYNGSGITRSGATAFANIK